MKISQYQTDPVAEVPDLLVGTEKSTGKTYNYPIEDVAAFINGGAYDDSWIQPALEGKVDDDQVLTNVPVGAVFTDTIYNDSWILPALNEKLDIVYPPSFKSTNYTTANKMGESTKMLIFNTTVVPYTIELASTGLTEGFKQQIFNDSGQEITFLSSEAIKGANIPLLHGFPAYYEYIGSSKWILSVGGAAPVAAGLQDISAGTNISIDKTNPAVPIISASVSGGGVVITTITWAGLQAKVDRSALDMYNITTADPLTGNTYGKVMLLSSNYFQWVDANGNINKIQIEP